MKLFVNNQKQTIKGETLNDLLLELQIANQGIAVAVNQKIVSRQKWENLYLTENDHVTIIKATRGG